MPPVRKSSKARSNPSNDYPSLTPQRKHRKLLKDGTSEVWPEFIEKIFVQGLRQYWDSPWATYSRGRSRWRNQFLVDYLQKAGVSRTKKQVASHIQVLRNMWKGEPEFHLVAGGEELFLDTGLLPPVKSECDTSNLIPLDFDEHDTLSPVTPSTPAFSPADFIFDPSFDVASYDSPSTPFSPGYQPSTLSLDLSAGSCSPSLPSPEAQPDRSCRPQRTTLGGTLHPQTKDPYSHAHAPPTALPADDSAAAAQLDQQSSTFADVLSPTEPLHPLLPENKLCFVALWADGMLPFTVPSDPSTAFRAPEPLAFRIRLRVPSIGDLCCSPTMHGFQGTISLARPWQYSAQCITKVNVGGTCISEDVGALQLVVSHSPSMNTPHLVQAFLPESSLSRCRWLDPDVQTCITQQIVVDDVNLGTIVYELDRKDAGAVPSAHLISIHRRAQPVLPPIQLPSPPLSPIATLPYYSNTTYGQDASLAYFPTRTRLHCRPESTSLSSALIPVGQTLTSLNTSLLF